MTITEKYAIVEPYYSKKKTAVFSFSVVPSPPLFSLSTHTLCIRSSLSSIEISIHSSHAYFISPTQASLSVSLLGRN